MIKVNGESLEHRQGMTVKDVLQAKNYVFPLLVVKVDGELVSREAFARHLVPDGGVIEVIHLTSGG